MTFEKSTSASCKTLKRSRKPRFLKSEQKSNEVPVDAKNLQANDLEAIYDVMKDSDVVDDSASSDNSASEKMITALWRTIVT